MEIYRHQKPCRQWRRRECRRWWSHRRYSSPHQNRWCGGQKPNARRPGIYCRWICGVAEDIWITRAKVHDYMGPAEFHYHCFYVEGQRNLIEYSECYNWVGGYGIHNYTEGGKASDNIYRYNWIHNIGNPNFTTFAIILTVGDNNQAYNNLITNNSNGINIGAAWQQSIQQYNLWKRYGNIVWKRLLLLWSNGSRQGRIMLL